MKYAIDVWLYLPPEDVEDPLTFDNFNDAMAEKEQLSLMQPENIYKLRVIPKETNDED
jgi:hypothetical protein